jgi:hypothetical protein
MNKKWDIEKAKELFNSYNCNLLETEYKNNRTPMRYIATCGHEHQISIDNINKGKGVKCKRCRYDAINLKKTNTDKEVRDFFESEGCKVLSDVIKGSGVKVKYIALCGHENQNTYTKFKGGSGRLCNKCSKSIRYEYDYVREVFENEDCELLEEEYINCKTPMKYKALCGHEAYTTLDLMLNAPSFTKKCRDCHKHSYAEIPEDRNLGLMKQWRKGVFQRDNWECQCCGKHGGKLCAHHLNSYDFHTEERFDIENGATLCEPCHITFHKTYGFGNNTRSQFYEWLQGIPR